MKRRRGFTLIELLVATLLSVVLTAGVLSVAAALARDTRRMQSQRPISKYDGALDAIRHDLMNARSVMQSPDERSLVIEGHGAIDQTSLRPSGRLCRVTYACRLDQKVWVLSRSQYLLDAPAAPQPWTTSICTGVNAISVQSLGGDDPTQAVPAWVNIRLAGDFGTVKRSEQLR
jgi:prepilin-type N-terminal cleavage/methylation domain-containing protein